jgi:hypothetical protein
MNSRALIVIFSLYIYIHYMSYTRICCYRIVNSQRESQILAHAAQLGLRVEQRRDCVDLLLEETAKSTLFLLTWSQDLLYLSWLDYHRSSGE